MVGDRGLGGVELKVVDRRVRRSTVHSTSMQQWYKYIDYTAMRKPHGSNSYLIVAC